MSPRCMSRSLLGISQLYTRLMPHAETAAGVRVAAAAPSGHLRQCPLTATMHTHQVWSAIVPPELHRPMQPLRTLRPRIPPVRTTLAPPRPSPATVVVRVRCARAPPLRHRCWSA
eukprot:TRINITY_DN34379_c0_g1_i1.p4 TRINITY_DN34379_c0_g1~~TRINITY_DN34379_c0_g1_i1.p4  ORF type:complete len:115 (-),score=6.02 TRINITY_DN34379_c0_g1_i1:71-415(-)